MPEILLTTRECSRGDLPDVCVVCGEPDAEFVSVRLKVALFSGPHSSVYRVLDSQLPVCAAHRNHFRRPTFIALGSVGCVVLLFLGVIGGSVALLPVLREKIFVFAGCGAVVCVLGLVAAITAFFLGTRGQVRATEIDRGVRLTNVAPAFVRAVKRHREEDE
jgi:hypothetical protein